jgi:hypothetical protein
MDKGQVRGLRNRGVSLQGDAAGSSDIGLTGVTFSGRGAPPATGAPPPVPSFEGQRCVTQRNRFTAVDLLSLLVSRVTVRMIGTSCAIDGLHNVGNSTVDVRLDAWASTRCA